MMSKINFKIITVLLIILSTLPGCAVNKATATIDPTVDISGLKVFHVKKYSEDTRGTNLIIENKLKEMGFQVSENETDVDAELTYIDKWFWDITFYMLELTVSLRDPKTDFPLATANSMHTSLTRKSQEGMADEVLTNIFFNNQKQGAPDAK